MIDSRAELSNLKKPVQKRSQATLQRILAGTRRLLRKKRFQDISIQEIASASKCGVGTVYGRFKHKPALLALLEQEVLADIVQRQTAFLTEREWSRVCFEERVEKLIAHILAGYKRHGVVLKELIGRIHLHTDGADPAARQSMSRIFEQDVDFLVDGLHANSNARSKKVVGLALISATLTIQNRLLQIDTSPINAGFSESFLRSHLPKMVVAYVRSEYPA